MMMINVDNDTGGSVGGDDDTEEAYCYGFIHIYSMMFLISSY